MVSPKFRNRRLVRAALLSVFSGIGTSMCNAQVNVVVVTSAPAAVFERSEWAVETGEIYKNPYDPSEVAVDATFTEPGGATRVVPAFWQPGGVGGDKKGAFKVRFLPDRAGSWKLRVGVVDVGGARVSEESVFDVAGSDRRGLIRVADNKRYFRYDNGTSYFPVGINLAWPPGDAREQWYEEMFATLEKNGANFARIWMAHPPVQIETDKTGLGRYSEENAAYFDRVFEAGERHGVGIMLCILNHRDFLVRDMWGPAGWPGSPYNAANGGPATRPADFFVGDLAKVLFKARLRYLAARYGAFTSLAFWELMNEQEFAPARIPPEWDQEMSAYLGKLDPGHRMVTTSAHVPEALHRHESMAITQSHLYGDGKQFDLVPSITSSIRDHRKFTKPHLIAESGIDSNGNDAKFDPKGRGTALHNSLWAAALGGSAGTSMYWWWDNYVGPKDLWKVYRPVADFVRPINFAGKRFEPIEVSELKRGDASGFSEMILSAGGGWGVKMNGPLVVPPNGRPLKALPTYFCGVAHEDLYAPIDLEIDFPHESKLTISAAKISDYALLRVSVDGRPIGDVLFSAVPGSPGTEKAEWDVVQKAYRATAPEPRVVPAVIPAGKHRVVIDAVAGDWVALTDLRFSNAVGNAYANLTTLALQDPASKETLAWVYDTRSTWKLDLDGGALESQSGVTMLVPNVSSGTWRVMWWDTREGKVVAEQRVTAENGLLTLKVPDFTRDIALRLVAAE